MDNNSVSTQEDDEPTSHGTIICHRLVSSDTVVGETFHRRRHQEPVTATESSRRRSSVSSDKNDDDILSSTSTSTSNNKPSNLTSFLAQLLEEQGQPCNTEEGDGDHGAQTVTLVSDNARAHPCHNLRLVRTDSSHEFRWPHHNKKKNHPVVMDVGDHSSIHEEKKEETEADALPSSQKQPETRDQEEESSSSSSSSFCTATNVRLLQRPCRWSSDDSLSNSMRLLPNSPPTKTDYLPTYPRRRSSKDMLLPSPDDLFDTSSSRHGRERGSPPRNGNNSNNSCLLEQSVFHVLARMEREDGEPCAAED